MSQAANEYFAKRQQDKLDKQKQIVETPVEPTPLPKQGVVPIEQPQVQQTQPQQSFLSEEDQIKRHGAVVGSEEYYKSKEIKEAPIKKFREDSNSPFYNEESGETVGEEIFKKMFRDVDDETWDKMSRSDQAKMIGGNAIKMPVGMITAIPIEIAKTPHRAVLSTIQLIKNLTSGKPWNAPEQEVYSPEYATALGEIPTYFKTREEYLENGFSEKSANVLSSLEFVGDAAIIGSSLQAVKSLKTTKVKLKVGEQATRTGEIEASLKKTEPVPADSVSEYVKLTDKAVIKEYGGTKGDTFLKVTPAGPESMEVAVVQRVKGLFGETKQIFKNKFGKGQEIYKGALGKEIKLSSDIVPVKKGGEAVTTKVPVPENIQQGVSEVLTEMELSQPGRRDWFTADPLAPGDAHVGAVPSTFPKWLPSEMRSTKLFESVSKKLETKNSVFTKPEERLVEELKVEMARKSNIPVDEMTTDAITDAVVGFKEVRELQKAADDIILDIREAPLKGQSQKLVTPNELDNINTIAKYKGLDDASVRAISKVITGKNIIGDLSNAEYTSLAKSMGTMAPADTTKALNLSGHKISPPANYSRYVEETTGVPLASEVYIPVEDAFRLAKNDVFNYSTRKNEIFGKYNTASFGEERRLVTSYIKGDKDIILKNEKLIPQVKTDLVKIAEDLKGLYNEAGQFYNVDMSKFGDLYQPSIRDVGRFQVYKQDMDLSKSAKSLTSFARFQKRGSIEPLLDDASSLFDIYVSSLSKEKYIQPVLKNISEKSYKGMTPELKKWTDNYVGEKLGQASDFEKKLNNLGTAINKRLGTNLDPEVIRNLTDDGLLTVYSGALGLPRLDAPVRDMITTTMLGYGRMGPKFYGSAVKKAMTKKYTDYMRTKGRLVEFGIPGGEDVAKSRLGMSAARSGYRELAQDTLKPYGFMDNKMRSIWSAQAEMQFDDLIAKHNAGKISWDKVKNDLQLKEMGTPMARTLEKRLLDNDIDGARDLFANSVIDEISFPYRKGTGAPLTYGVGGSLAFNLSNWTIHFGHTMGRWVKTGQWQNFMRFVAAGAVAQRSLADALGIDAGRFTEFTRIANPTLSPTIQLGINTYNGIMAVKDENRKKINTAFSTIWDTIKNLGIPGGVGTQNWLDFKKSYNSAGSPGVPEGMFRVYNQSGGTREFADFTDILFRGLGFQTEKETETSEFLKTSANLKEERAQATDRAKQLIIEGVSSSNPSERQKKLEQATGLIKEFQITRDFSDVYESFNKPLIMSSYDSFDPILKARFAKWYSELLKGEYNIKE